ncbi:hypothetical protein ACA348_08970 [Orientia tsutsugamushi]|uniref:hypothetical protein n=1 Tax=Orientia tsutsugamushi TaxID=784 RepID=UPI00352892CD
MVACDVTISKSCFSLNEYFFTKKIFIKAKTSFADSYIKSNFQLILECAFEAQGFSFELVQYK